MSWKIHVAGGEKIDGSWHTAYCGLDYEAAHKEFLDLVSGKIPGISRAFLYKKPECYKSKKVEEKTVSKTATVEKPDNKKTKKGELIYA